MKLAYSVRVKSPNAGVSIQHFDNWDDMSQFCRDTLDKADKGTEITVFGDKGQILETVNKWG